MKIFASDKSNVKDIFGEETNISFLKRIKWKLENIRIKYWELKNSIKSLWKWIPVVWYDRDYDHTFILKILKHKLTFVYKLHEKNQRYEGWENNVKYMKICIKLIDIINDEKYIYDEMYPYLKNKYGESHFRFIPTQSENCENCSELLIEHDNINNGLFTQEEYDEEYDKLSKFYHNKQEKAKKLLYKILLNKLEQWWD